MSRTARFLTAGGVLLLALAFAANAPARYFDEIEDARKDVTQLAKMYADAKGKIDEAKVKAITAAIKKKYDDMGPLMSIYKPSDKKGVGFNPAKKGKGDGMEKRIIDLGKRAPTADILAKEKDLLVRMATYNLAMHAISRAYAPEKPKAGKGAKEWNKYNDEMKEGTEAFLTAVRANNPGGVKKAAERINAACNDCHTDFR